MTPFSPDAPRKKAVAYTNVTLDDWVMAEEEPMPDLAAARSRHVRYDEPGTDDHPVCYSDFALWPCDAAQAFAALDKAEAYIDRICIHGPDLADELGKALRECLRHMPRPSAIPEGPPGLRRLRERQAAAHAQGVAALAKWEASR